MHLDLPAMSKPSIAECGNVGAPNHKPVRIAKKTPLRLEARSNQSTIPAAFRSSLSSIANYENAPPPQGDRHICNRWITGMPRWAIRCRRRSANSFRPYGQAAKDMERHGDGSAGKGRAHQRLAV